MKADPNEIWWIKYPSPGQFPSEGVWVEVDQGEYDAVEEFLHCEQTGCLPTDREIVDV